ncbi:MAG TPA: hypothetical protein VKM72_27080 [Thermoanaerobaculia bacterium]|nr:hypothetical protein [Thermoanaerobaculia bacterium]
MQHRALLSPLLALLVATAACYDKDDYVMTPGAVETQLVLLSKSGANKLPADGFSRLGLIARISPRADADRRTVVFSTSAGTLVGGTAEGTTREVAADASGEAFIELQSSQRIETAVVSASVKGVSGLSTNLAVAFEPLDPNNILNFIGGPAGPLPADGATLTPFSVMVGGSVPPDATGQRQVQFTTTVGKLGADGLMTLSVPVDAGNVATVDLESPAQITTGHLRATINGVTRDVPLSFARALPQRITLITDVFTVNADATGQANLTATLSRDIGQVTDGTTVIFSAKGDDGDLPSTFFQNVTLTSGGTATAVFRPGATTYEGPVTITARVEGSDALGTVRLEIVKPE